MARVSGPLFSVSASGAYAGTLVFASWRGRQYVRELVTPSNPRTIGQETARNRMRVTGAAQRWVNANMQIHAGLTLTDKTEIVAVTPSQYAWNGYLVDQMIGTGGINMTAADAIWAGLSGAEQTAWDNAANGLTTLMPAVAQTIAGGAAGTPKSSGQVFLNYQYGLFVIGLVAIPTAVPPVYT